MKRIFFYSLFLFACMANGSAYDRITSGVTWNDTNGARISAHGGQVVYSNGAYYWIGENKPGDHSTGVSCYKSTDLYNWQKLALALTPTGTMSDPDKGNDIAQGRNLERPKIMYNDLTNKWVMWIHWENGEHYGEARACVATSDKVEGPYKFINTFRPNGHDSRDQTIFKDTDGKGYHFANIHFSDMNIDLLSDDFLTATETQNNTFAGRKLEAPAIFKVGETYYGVYSLSDGWKPTAGQSGYTNNIMGTWTYYGNFAVDSEKATSYKSQSTCVFKVNGYDNAFVYMGDRWDTGKDATSYYVWLPLSVRTGYPVVKWYAEWKIADIFKDVDRYKRTAAIGSGNTYMLLDITSDRFLSQNTKNGIHIADDDEAINLKYNIIETEKPYVYKIQDAATEKFYESIFGSLRQNAENDKVSQEWLFLLQADGSYKIKSNNEEKYFCINGNSALAGSGLYLSDKAKARAFGVYFDQKTFPDYEVADMYGATYRDEIKVLVKEQTDYLNALAGIDAIRPDAGPATIQVYGISGQLLYTQKNYTGASVIPATIAENLKAGVYLVKRISGTHSSVQKVIVK
ncbi:MAG: hypothetical protein EZS26_001974 [Candidatus Ordinivivax streblomastigis]|uniref:Uncharacterized protein n=1 Tax=Candidatus Ordinivivax streblomastigis TaxID=2540710 RepID=A0A5M8P079_9BACT|nr:MAG: hypothetical protein EZS26_001974 [Candidatus Ordinivivax streblomastigis]